jgi:hypothetical protein
MPAFGPSVFYLRISVYKVPKTIGKAGSVFFLPNPATRLNYVDESPQSRKKRLNYFITT